MRIAFSRLWRIRLHSRANTSLQRCLCSASHAQLKRGSPCALNCPPARRNNHATARTRTHDDDDDDDDEIQPPRRNLRDNHKQTRDEDDHTKSSGAEADQSVDRANGPIPSLSLEQRQNPDTWVGLLEEYLPHDLISKGRRDQTRNKSNSDGGSDEVLIILRAARKTQNTGRDILAYMILNSRKEAALWLIDSLLNNFMRRASSETSDLPPSNIGWPKLSLHEMTGGSITVDSVSRPVSENCDNWDNCRIDSRYSTTMSRVKDDTMDLIWSSLGSAVVQSADEDQEKAQEILNAVQLVLGQVHNLNLVPDNVYSYQTSAYNVTVQRPPIIHLLSSRILTALSDATWRVQQQDNIKKAASHGLSYEQIGRDPPGGRFRLKVRPLTAEVWLEFILWCCVEGGFVGAGTRIISLLQQDIRDPWFAISWSTGSNAGQSTPFVDWDRVKMRTGGTVGRIEGYSTVKPLAEIPSRTISTEVVLALVEAHVDAVKLLPDSNGMALGAVQNGIVNLISFLEPHDLHVSYFDYLSARLFLTDAFTIAGRSNLLKRWSERLSILKSLKPVQQPLPPRASFRLRDLLEHSELTAGIIHQVIDSFVQDGNIHDALKAFNDLQKLVDNSKLHAIGAFLRRADSLDENFFTSPFFIGTPDFVNSHGQLPLYKLSGLLDLATDTNLIGFGQWLLHSNDPDGPLIPRSSYGNAGIARSLVRFAGLSNDERLLSAVPSSSSLQSSRLPTVSFLRASFNARLSLYDFDAASKILDRLNLARGGGYGLSNLAFLAGTILKLENDATHNLKGSKESLLYQATYMLNLMLAGHVDGRSGVLQRSIRTTFKQQVTHLLTIFQAYGESSIATFAGLHRERFRTSNVPNLSSSVFNIFLEQAIEAKGATHGVKLVDMFCLTASQDDEYRGVLGGDFLNDEHHSLDSDSDQKSYSVSEPSDSGVRPDESFVPFASDSGFDTETGHEEGDDIGYSGNQPRQPEDEPTSQIKSTDPIQPRNNTESFTSAFFPQKAEHEMDSSDRLQTVHVNTDSGEIEPVCRPDLRTIRLVIHKVIREGSGQRSGTSGANQQSDMLRWARRKLVDLGCSPYMISNEIRQPVAEDGELGSRGRRTMKSRYARKPSRASRTTQSFGGTKTTRRTT